MEYQDPNLLMLQLTYLPFDDVVSVCSLNRRYHEVCYNEDHVYDNQWRQIIENTYSFIPNYQELISGKRYNYITYTQLIRELDNKTQLRIYFRQNDMDSFNSDRFSYIERDGFLQAELRRIVMEGSSREGNIKRVERIVDFGGFIHGDILLIAFMNQDQDMIETLIKHGGDIRKIRGKYRTIKNAMGDKYDPDHSRRCQGNNRQPLAIPPGSEDYWDKKYLIGSTPTSPSFNFICPDEEYSVPFIKPKSDTPCCKSERY